MSEVCIELSEFYALKRSGVKGVCSVRGCTRRVRSKGRSLCSAHNMQLWRARNPKRAAYEKLKGHARSRKIEFVLSFEEFLGCIQESGYEQTDSGLHIDRINAALGYSKSNIRILPASDNIVKGNKERRNLEYRIALFERLGYSDQVVALRSELEWLTGLDWVDPDFNFSHTFKPEADCPF